MNASSDDNDLLSASTSVVNVRCEYGEPALGVGTPTPRLSWQVTTTDPDWEQTGYEMERDGCSVYVPSTEQVFVPWPFEPLHSRERAIVRIRVASEAAWTGWSVPITIEAGLLTADDWLARFITPSTLGGIGASAPVLARTFTLRSGVCSARLYITALGTYSASINGFPVGDLVLAPGWTSYHKRLCYQTYDVTELVRLGENQIEVLLGNGRYRGRIGPDIGPGPVADPYGERLAVLAQLEATYADSSRETFATDDTWTARDSGILHNDLYDGQVTDMRVRSHTQDTVEILPTDTNMISASEGPPMRVTGLIQAADVWTSPSGATLVDFEQNLVGWVRLCIKNATPNSSVTIRHAELLEDGELCTRTLLGARATDTYILPGANEIVVEPSLTFHGFRYAEVTGVPELRKDDIQAVVVNADLHKTGWFSCSDPDLNRFHENVVWSVRSNFLDVPTDCPQRAERLGWTGDVQAIAPTASFLFDACGSLSSWLRDLACDQREDGSVPWIVPDLPATTSLTANRITAGWGDAATVVPWVLYQRYGDRVLLERQLPSMTRWVDRVAAATEDGVRKTGFQWGDHFSPWYEQDREVDRDAENAVLATAYLVRSADIVAEAARTLSRYDEADRYTALAERTRDAFARKFVARTGRLASETPTAYALAIEWDLIPTQVQRQNAGKRLAELVRDNSYRACTGYLGTPLITDALCSAGFPDIAYRLMMERQFPSWLYPVTIGATTVWETWRAVLPDGKINGIVLRGRLENKLAGMSLNHFALGAVVDWMYRTVAGLAPVAPGYREITVRPIPHSLLDHAEVTHLTPYGRAAVAWRRSKGQFILDVTVPAGATATVYVPGKDPETVRHGSHAWTVTDPCEPAAPHASHAQQSARDTGSRTATEITSVP